MRRAILLAFTAVPYDPRFLSTRRGISASRTRRLYGLFSGNGRETRIIDVLKGEGVGLDWYAKRLFERNYVWGSHYLPHDVEVRELGTGKSRKEVLEGLGIKVTVCPNIPIADGIQAVRMLLPTCWFDKVKCKDGIEACACIAANMTRSGRSSNRTRCTTGPVTTRTR
jgi:phage terminase large subunit